LGGGIHTLQEWYDPTGREIALRRILLTLLDTTQTTAASTAPTLTGSSTRHWAVARVPVSSLAAGGGFAFVFALVFIFAFSAQKTHVKSQAQITLAHQQHPRGVFTHPKPLQLNQPPKIDRTLSQVLSHFESRLCPPKPQNKDFIP
jgi:hypothetical protein